MLVREGLRWKGVEGVDNSAGKLGAVIGDVLVGEWFGAFAVCIPVVLIVLALRIMRVRPLFLNRSVRIVLIVMILGSVSLGYLFGKRWGIFGSGLGGSVGVAAAEWLTALLGKIGLGLLLLMSWVLLAVYINRRTISAVNKVGRAVAKGATDILGQIVPDTTEGQDRPTNEEFPERVEEISESILPKEEGEILIEEGYRKEELSDDEESVPSKEEGPIDEIIRNSPSFDEDDVFEVVNSEGERVSRSVSDSQSTTSHVAVGAGGIVESDENGIEVLVPEKHDVEVEDDDIDMDLYDPTRELSGYQRPPIEILTDHSVGIRISEEEIRANKNIIREKLNDFKISITDKIRATVGPTVTLYEIEPAQGVKISSIRNLEEDIALALKVQSIRIVTLGQGRGTVGIEVPNSTREIVSMYSVVKSLKFQDCNYRLPVVLGKTIYNETYVMDLTKMPHLLVAGATGQGKSVGLNAIITSLLYKKHPAELKFVLVDPKQVELSVYAKLEKHFLAKMESEENAILTDTQKVVYTLNSLVIEMENRYTLLNKAGERNIADYNEKFLRRRLNPKNGHRFMPYIVVIIDEFADMIMTAGKEVEIPITRLAAKARAIGIHLIVATQRPDVKVITGLIKSNIPARIAFKVVSMVDSRTILDHPGANNLIGMGDMLLSRDGEMTRIQCAFIDTPEIERVTDFISRQKGYSEPYPLPDYEPEESGTSNRKEEVGQLDPMFEEVARFVVQNQQGSTSSIQRRFSIGYNRAGRLMDQLEAFGIVGRPDGAKPREVLVFDMGTLERIFAENGV